MPFPTSPPAYWEAVTYEMWRKGISHVHPLGPPLNKFLSFIFVSLIAKLIFSGCHGIRCLRYHIMCNFSNMSNGIIQLKLHHDNLVVCFEKPKLLFPPAPAGGAEGSSRRGRASWSAGVLSAADLRSVRPQLGLFSNPTAERTTSKSAPPVFFTSRAPQHIEPSKSEGREREDIILEESPILR